MNRYLLHIPVQRPPFYLGDRVIIIQPEGLPVHHHMGRIGFISTKSKDQNQYPDSYGVAILNTNLVTEVIAEYLRHKPRNE